MRIDFDPAKRKRTLEERGLDFRDAEDVFVGAHFTAQDDRRDYGEIRYVTVGVLFQRVIVIGWTPREEKGETVRRVFSMRKANEKEAARYWKRLGQG